MDVNHLIELMITIICSVLASSGFWTFFMARKNRDWAQKDMLKGLAHDRIMELGMRYIERGYITKDEYENLIDYLWKPYAALNGNGSAERVIKECMGLPIKDHKE